MSTTPRYLCRHCGHPVPAPGISILPEDDYDHTGSDRARCDDAACESSAVATYDGRRLIEAIEAP